MPIYDRRCDACEEVILECYETINFSDPVPCKRCGEPTRRALLSGRQGSVISDDIPGGIEIRHGLCNEDGTPRRYYSKSEIAAEAKRRGLVNYVEHVPGLNGDKSKHTTRWV